MEKSLKHAMRARHSELTQESRAQIAQQVLGIAVAYGRLQHVLLGGGFKHFLIFTRKLGKVPILTDIFFKGVGSSTNQVTTFATKL